MKRTRNTTKTAFSFKVPTLAQTRMKEVDEEIAYLQALDMARRDIEQLHGPAALLVMDVEELFGGEFTLKR